jgi:eukaryotic-like serine/threonine-protein kinase
VSSGPPTTTVPSVVGLTEANAIDALESKGFKVNVTEQSTPDPTKDGKVLSQNPAGNTTAERGSTVSIVVGVFSGEPPPDS